MTGLPIDKPFVVGVLLGMYESLNHFGVIHRSVHLEPDLSPTVGIFAERLA